VVSDGAPGLLGAVEQVFSRSLRQRCTIHRARNVLAKVPASGGADGQHAGQGMPTSPPVTGVGQHRQPLQQARALAQGKRARMAGVGNGSGDGG
jgi:Transposase, Mutator family